MNAWQELADALDVEADRYEKAEPIHWRAMTEATRDHARRIRNLVNAASNSDAAGRGELQQAEAVEKVAADRGHWAASAFPDADEPRKQHIVCECGLPWTPGEGCVFVQGARAALLASGALASPAEAETARRVLAGYIATQTGTAMPTPPPADRCEPDPEDYALADEWLAHLDANPAEAETAVAVDGSLTEPERDRLCDWWDEDATASVESAFPIVARIVAQRTAAAKAEARKAALSEAGQLVRDHVFGEVDAERIAAFLDSRADRLAAESDPT